MKVIISIVAGVYLFSHTCDNSTAHHPQQEPITQTVVVTNNISPVDFTREIQPILEKRCSPCHFTGGKMYEKMPFDKPQTILDHTAGILKRIKEEKENALFKSFIEQNSKK